LTKGDSATAEDLVAETQIRILGAAERIEASGPLAYSRTVLKHLFLDHIRKKHAEVPLEEAGSTPTRRKRRGLGQSNRDGARRRDGRIKPHLPNEVPRSSARTQHSSRHRKVQIKQGKEQNPKEPPHPASSEGGKHITKMVNTIHEVGIDTVQPHPQNPRIGNVDAITQSIKAHGFYSAIVVSKRTGNIVAGSHRWKAMREMGSETIPVTFQDLTPEQELQILLADNKASDKAGYDKSALAEVMRIMSAAGIDLTGTLYDPQEIKNLLRFHHSTKDSDKDSEPTRADELQAKWQVKKGDVWQVGEHRIACGSSGDHKLVARLMGEQRARMIWTDPPYGVDVHTKGKGNKQQQTEIAGDKNAADAIAVFSAALRAAITEPAAGIYVACPSTYIHLFIEALNTNGFEYHHALVWVKNSLVLSRADYHYRHEPILLGSARTGDVHRSEQILYGWRPKQGGHFFVDDRSQNTVFEYDRPTASIEHPTMKPVPLVAEMVKNSSKMGEIVYDPFCGSGTTLLACEDQKRCGYGVELMPQFVAVTIERLTKLGMTAARM
jgi:DNA modification methylase